MDITITKIKTYCIPQLKKMLEAENKHCNELWSMSYKNRLIDPEIFSNLIRTSNERKTLILNSINKYEKFVTKHTK